MKSTAYEFLTTSRGSAQEFIQERKYLKAVTAKTIAWYEQSFKSFADCQTETDYKNRVVQLRDRGVSAISVNTWLRCINAYLKWKGAGYKLPKLKEEQKIIQALSTDQIQVFINHRPAKGTNLKRAWMVAIGILDTGLRVAEITGLKHQAIDFDNLTIRVKGKGGKERLVPFSFEFRKLLFKFLHSGINKSFDYVFATRTGTKVSIRNLERDLKILGQRIGITNVRMSPHTFRHSFACSYLRAGGNLFYLSRILGHSSIKTTELYLKSLGIEDLSNAHKRFSPLVQNPR